MVETVPADWPDDAPTSGVGQSCAFCGCNEVVWVHPLAPSLVAFRQYGKGHTLPSFWTLCDRCEELHKSGDEDSIVAVMRESSAWPDDTDDEVVERIRKPLLVFRRADLGARRLDPEPLGVAAARRHGFVPLMEWTGVGTRLGPLWPAGDRLWTADLAEGWMIRSPWTSLSVPETLNALWRWLAPIDPNDAEAWEKGVLAFFRLADEEALELSQSEP